VTGRRIQRKRTRGWRMPPGAVYVGRSGRWGNPFVVHSEEIVLHPDGRDWWCPIEHGGGQQGAVDLFRELVDGLPGFQNTVRAELRGRDLACWCPLDQPCHADVLLEVANR
jgi:hypothetical protein